MTVEELKTLSDEKIEAVDIPEWPEKDGTPLRLYVKSLMVPEVVAWQARPASDIPSTISLLTLCVCDASGNLFFKPEDATWLAGRSAAAIGRLVEVAMRLNIPDAKVLEKN